MGKPKHSNDPRGEQKGAQQHAEGQHGPKAFEAKKLEVAYGGADKPEAPRKANDPRANDGSDADLHERKIGDPAGQRDGGHRLWENRVQHDEGDRAAEKNRRIADVERHGHDSEQFQIPGGNESHPAVPRDAHADIKSTGAGGGNRSAEDRGK